MKDLATDFKAIAKKDKALFVWMGLNLILSFVLFASPFLHLNPDVAKRIVRYSDIASYANSDWWYLTTFSVISLTMGIGHTLLSARLYTKRGRDVARLFLGISMALIVTAMVFLGNILGEG